MIKSGYLNGIFRFIALTISLLLLYTGIPEAGEDSMTQVVRVIGAADVRGDNVAKAREKAIAKSLIGAIESVVLNMMPPEKLVEKFQAANETIAGHTDSFIEHYKVLAESTHGTAYRVMVEATVSISKLKERFADAGIKLTVESLPTVLLMISERNMDDLSARFWWGDIVPTFKATAETAISELLESDGFSIIDPGVTMQTLEIDPDNIQPDITAQGAVVIGKQLGADVVLVGRSQVERTENVMGDSTRSFNAGITVRVINTANSEEIAATDQSATTVNIDASEGTREALVKAGSLAGEALSLKIAAVWKKEAGQPSMIRIEVEGTSNLGNFVLFRKILSDISGVNKIQMRELKADTSTLMVDYSGPTKTLADSLMVKTYETFSISISEVTEEHLRVELVSHKSGT